MKIISISLKNFLCYSGDNNEFQFTDGLNLILGGGGYGKTKLYDAFYWVFFDWITSQQGTPLYTASLKSQLISKKAIAETNQGKIECNVNIVIKTNREEYQIERKYFVNKTGDKLIEAEKSKVHVYKKTVLEFKPESISSEEEFRAFVNEKIIPTDILNHIWFQGERGIRNAVDTSNAKALHQVINKISYIDQWERYIQIADNALNRVRKEFDTAVKSSNKQRDKKKAKQQELQQIEKRIEKNKQELETRLIDLQKVHTSIDNISINEDAQAKINQLKIEETNLLNQKKRITEKLESLTNQMDRNLFDEYWMIYGTNHVTRNFDNLFRDYIYSKQKSLEAAADDLPKIPKGNPKATHIRQMLFDKHCHVCDRPAPEGSEAYVNIQRLLPENYPAAKEKVVDYKHDTVFRNLSNTQSGISLKYSSFKEKADNTRADYFQLEQERVDIEEAIEKTKEQKVFTLSNFGIESLDSGVQIAQRFKSLSNDAERFSGRISILKSEIKKDETLKEKIEAEFTKLVSDEIDEALTKKLQYFKSLAYATKNAKDAQYKKLVSLLEEETNRHYENINKDTGAFYGEVKFHENINTEGYTAKVHDGNGEDITNGLNTSQMLAMQFSILLAILSTNKKKGLNRRYPLISDAPNSTFDAKKWKLLFKEIGQTFDQAIVMVFEYLEDDPNRERRFMIKTADLEEITQEIKSLGININVIALDIPDGVNQKRLKELSIDIKPVSI